MRTLRLVFAALAVALLAPGAAGANTQPGFVAHCPFSHRAADDPLVHPHMPGHSHRHDFFGNRSTDSHSTIRSLLLSETTTCDPPADRSAYWVPTLSHRRRAVTPAEARFYYVVLGAEPGSVRPFPRGLRVIAGNAAARRPPGRPAYGWTCTGATVLAFTRIPRCPRASELVLKVRFPDCWDGRRRDSRGHQRHMAYGSGRRCPASHPVAVPQLRFELRYPTRGGAATKLASGPPWTAHGDFMNAWDPAEFERRLRECLQASVSCREDGSPYVEG